MSIEAQARLSALTPRQLETLRLAALGHTSREIGRRLEISPKTVERHLEDAVYRLELTDRPQAIRLLLEATASAIPYASPVKLSPPRPTSGPERGRIFISYHQENAARLSSIRNILLRFDYKIYQYVPNMTVEQIQSSDWFVCLATREYLNSSFHLKELIDTHEKMKSIDINKLVVFAHRTPALSLLPAVNIVNIDGLAGKALEAKVTEAFKVAVEKGTEAAPIPNVASPIRYETGADARVKVVGTPAPQNLQEHVLYALRKQTASAEQLATRLLLEASSPHFNHSRYYAERLTQYLEDIPGPNKDGNIYLSDAIARAISAMFTSEAGILPVHFKALLRSFLECHIGVRAFYPELADFYSSVRGSAISEPLPVDAIEHVMRVITDNTPAIFDPSVTAALEKEKEAFRIIEKPNVADATSADQDGISPPIDPILVSEPRRVHHHMVARSLNGMWKVFLTSKDISSNIDGWYKVYTELMPGMISVIHFIRISLGL